MAGLLTTDMGVVEVWKDVPGYEGRYQVSSHGRVKGPQSRIGKPLKQGPDDHGYMGVSIYNDGNHRIVRVHQLVAMAFLGHTLNGRKVVINHIDHNILNNCVDNLELVSHRANCLHRKVSNSSGHPGVIIEKGRTKRKYRVAVSVMGKHKTIGRYLTLTEAATAHQQALNQLER